MVSTARRISLSLATVLLVTMISGQSFADNGNAATNSIGQQANISASVACAGGPSFMMIIGLIFR